MFIKAFSEGTRPVVYGDGKQTRDFTFVADVVHGVLKAAEAPKASGEVFNVGTGERIRLLDLVAALNRILGTNLEAEFLPPRPGDVRDSLASLDRIGRVLGYRPVVPFEEGLRRTVEASLGCE